MTNELDNTERFPDGGTAPILERIAAELRGLREESRATRLAVEDLGARVDRLEPNVRALRGQGS